MGSLVHRTGCGEPLAVGEVPALLAPVLDDTATVVYGTRVLGSRNAY